MSAATDTHNDVRALQEEVGTCLLKIKQEAKNKHVLLLSVKQMRQ